MGQTRQPQERNRQGRLLVALGSSALALALLAGCADPGSGSAQANAQPGAPSSGPPSAAPATLTTAQARERFLTIVCPVTTSLKIVNNIPIEAGGWAKVRPAAGRPYVQSVATEARSAAARLTSADTVWPPAVQGSVQEMSDTLLGFLVPLGEMSKAPTGAAMATPWSAVASNPRTAEQRIRLDLGLPAANAVKDGCPPVPVATSPRPTSSPKPRASTPPSSSTSSSGPSNPYSLAYAEYARGRICLSSSSSLPVSLPGYTGRGVTLLQWAITALGFAPGPLDGEFGPKTESAVRSFQYTRQIAVDGQVGPQTWRAIKQGLC